MYIHLFVIIDTPANSSLIMYSLLYLPLFVIVDTPDEDCKVENFQLYLPLFVIVDTPRVIYLSVYQLNMVVHG